MCDFFKFLELSVFICFPFRRVFTLTLLHLPLAKVDAVLTVVDAKHIRGHLNNCNKKDEKKEGEKEKEEINESFQQIAFADKILLNKLDLVTEEDV